MRNTDYSYRMHPRMTEDDPELATVMYSTHGIEGPWHDMATGHPDWIDEILGALIWREDVRRQQAAEESARLRLELAGYNKLVDGWDAENKFGITLESQGSAKLVANLLQLVERLRDVNPYSPAQVTELAREAASLLEASRG